MQMRREQGAAVTLESIRSSCAQCKMHDMCGPLELGTDDMQRVEALVTNRRRLERHQFLYHAGAPFEAVFAVRSGSFKTVVPLEDGREQVTGFQLSGDLLGLDGISTDHHSCNVIALESSEVCVISFAALEQLLREASGLQRQFHRLMSEEIVREHGMIMMLGTMRAEERLAGFLISLSRRLHKRGFSAHEFNLRMTREEIGSFLGLKLETVSRAFSHLQDAGHILVRQRKVQLLNVKGLAALVKHAPLPSDPQARQGH